MLHGIMAPYISGVGKVVANGLVPIFGAGASIAMTAINRVSTEVTYQC